MGNPGYASGVRIEKTASPCHHQEQENEHLLQGHRYIGDNQIVIDPRNVNRGEIEDGRFNPGGRMNVVLDSDATIASKVGMEHENEYRPDPHRAVGSTVRDKPTKLREGHVDERSSFGELQITDSVLKDNPLNISLFKQY